MESSMRDHSDKTPTVILLECDDSDNTRHQQEAYRMRWTQVSLYPKGQTGLYAVQMRWYRNTPMQTDNKQR